MHTPSKKPILPSGSGHPPLHAFTPSGHPSTITSCDHHQDTPPHAHTIRTPITACTHQQDSLTPCTHHQRNLPFHQDQDTHPFTPSGHPSTITSCEHHQDTPPHAHTIRTPIHSCPHHQGHPCILPCMTPPILPRIHTRPLTNLHIPSGTG